MCGTGDEEEVGPSLQLAQKNYAEMQARVAAQELAAPIEYAQRWRSDTLDEIQERIEALEQFMRDVKNGRTW